MVNQLWASSRIVSQNNRGTRADDEANNHNERAPQGMLQRPQNHHVSLNNFGLGRYQENNVADARTQPMVPFSFSNNNMMSVREVERHNQWEGEYQIPILYRSSDIHFRTPQGILERSQNRHVSLNNFTQGMYHDNNVVSSRPPSMTPFSFANNNTTSFMTSTRYDQMLSSGLPSDPQPHMGPHIITPYRANSIQNSSSNGVGFQGHANNFANPSRPFFHSRRSFRYLPYGESSNRVNNSEVFNNFRARLSVDLHSFNGANNDAIPITTPSSNANRDLARDRAPESYAFDIRDTDDGYEAGQAKEIKLLDLFKDENNATPTSSVDENEDTNENDEDNLDLSLHL